MLAQKLRCMCVAQGMKPDGPERRRAHEPTIAGREVIGQPKARRATGWEGTSRFSRPPLDSGHPCPPPLPGPASLRSAVPDRSWRFWSTPQPTYRRPTRMWEGRATQEQLPRRTSVAGGTTAGMQEVGRRMEQTPRKPAATTSPGMFAAFYQLLSSRLSAEPGAKYRIANEIANGSG